MFPNRAAFAVLVVACVAAAGGGAYIATRQNLGSTAVPTASAAVPAETPAAATDASGASPASAGLNSAPAPVTKAPSPAVAPKSAPAERPAPRPDPVSTRTPVRTPVPAVPQTAQFEEPTQSAPSPVAAAPVFDPPAVRDEPPADSARPQLPPARRFEDLVVAADSVIGLRMEGTISSETARVEDRVEARVVRDVRVNGEVAIPAGARAMGTVVLVERGGKLKDRARLGIRFHELLLPDSSRLPLSTDTIYRYGDARGDASAAKIGGGAVAGAILGAIIGGGKGAAIGATTGAGAGGAAVAAGDRSTAIFPSGAGVTARILSPVTVTVERE